MCEGVYRMIGENIRALRKRYGETQKELAEALKLTEQAVSHYEKGKRVPDIQTIESIANHYMITPEQLISSDLRNIPEVEISANFSQLTKLSEVMYPTFISDKAMKDNAFKKGYNYLLRIERLLKKGKGVPYSLLVICENSFIDSWNESETIESVANLLKVFFFKCSMFEDENEIAMAEAMSNGRILNKNLIKKYGLRREKREQNKSKSSFIESNLEFVMQCIRILKDDPDWAELGDYYFATRYYFGMIDTDFLAAGFSQETNRQIWLQLLWDLCQVRNIYALDFMKSYFELFPED